jgi:hypothetical protein
MTESEAAASGSAPHSEEIKLAPQRLRAQSPGALVVDVALPSGYHLNPSAPQRYSISVEGGAKHLALGDDANRVAKDLQLPLRIPLRVLDEGGDVLRVQLTLFYCREDNTGTCQIKTLVWRAPVEVTADADAPREIRAQGKVEAQ